MQLNETYFCLCVPNMISISKYPHFLANKRDTNMLPQIGRKLASIKTQKFMRFYRIVMPSKRLEIVSFIE